MALQGLGRELSRLGFSRGGQGQLFDENLAAARMHESKMSVPGRPIAESKQGMVVQVMGAMQRGEITRKQARDLIEKM